MPLPPLMSSTFEYCLRLEKLEAGRNCVTTPACETNSWRRRTGQKDANGAQKGSVPDHNVERLEKY